jgi:drug/metabolite transporter (DMT)-like permease
LLAACFVANKLYEKNAGTSLEAGFTFNIMLGFLAATIFFCVSGFKFEFTPYSMIMATVLTILVVNNTLLGFRIIKDGSVSVYTLFLMSGGMTVPYIYGILFLDEDFTVRRTIGIVMLICAVALSSYSGKGTRIKTSNLLMCIAVFISNGFVSVTSKLHQNEYVAFSGGAQGVHAAVDTTHFVILSGIAKIAVCGIVLSVLLIIKKLKATKCDPACDTADTNDSSVKFEIGKNWWKLLIIIVSAAVLDSVSYFLQLKGAANLPATITYPMITGATIVFMPIAAFIAFREKPTKYIVISVILSFCATLLFL